MTIHKRREADIAIPEVLAYAGLRVEGLAGTGLNEVEISSPKIRVIVGSDKGLKHRRARPNADARPAADTS